ncbi:putative lipopolysaccharide heptosyltransferase III [Neisseria animalis]|uniref:Putative lipopolysaccharide heptosyltransferase III n=1 Tax=Neisseria animalis TaxID=492 RepID=A0A5P3MRV7_NEIAN|nr:putative lipopolysaccharide heptosyltransferase III [Neisseria animalis]QEY24333.1 putative lipopolysaccharide heptosyltransferase III [Neisseria animalis]ROW32266.1 putative lipopolysaccharide heptosyltransferase III [Neisseria animalis]VEE06806.1 RfaC [Neisseria animalis]
MSLARPNRILIIKLRHHGDVLLSTPVAAAVKQRFPDCEIDMLVYRETADIIRDNPLITQIFTIDRDWKKQSKRAQFTHEKNLFLALKARGYDWAFNLSDQWRAAIIAKYCARSSIGLAYSKRDNALWRFCHDFVNPDLDWTHHVVDRHLNILPPLIHPHEIQAEVSMVVSNDTRISLRQKLRAQGWNEESYVLVHPGSRWLFKCWEDDKSAALVQLLLNHGRNVVLTASPDKTEQAILEAITESLQIHAGVNVWTLSGNINLRELAAAIEGAEMFVGVDSVPMHIAAALDKPQVALFGPSWVSRWRPYSENAEIIWAGDFGELPNPETIDTRNTNRMLKAIPLEAVWEKVRQKLNQTEQKAV